MRLLKITGVVTAVLGMAALFVVYAPELAGQARVRASRARQLDVIRRGAHIGVSVRDLEDADAKREKTATASGAVIDEVYSDTPASRAGLKAGDVVVEYDGERVRSARQFARLVDETPEGRTVKLTAARDGQRMTMDITPEGRGFGDPWVSGEVLDRLEDVRIEVPPVKLPGFEFKTFTRTGRLGIQVDTLTPQLAAYFGTKGGVLVTSVNEGSAAEKAGIKAGDVITTIDGRTVEDFADLQRALLRAGESSELSIEIVRDRKPQTVKAKPETLEKRPLRRRFTEI